MARPGAEAEPRPTFRAKGPPGSASITVAWTDLNGEHEQTFTFEVKAGPAINMATNQ